MGGFGNSDLELSESEPDSDEQGSKEMAINYPAHGFLVCV